MADPLMPDLSHLSPEERAIIEQVFQRQKEEEQKEVKVTEKADKELVEIERQINERKDNAQKLVGTHDDAICQICVITKFADGIGNKCFYCQLRSCMRCGSRTHSKNKSIWACSLCQKRQSILAKTGKWFQPEDGLMPDRKDSSSSILPPLDEMDSMSAGTSNNHIIMPVHQMPNGRVNVGDEGSGNTNLATSKHPILRQPSLEPNAEYRRNDNIVPVSTNNINNSAANNHQHHIPRQHPPQKMMGPGMVNGNVQQHPQQHQSQIQVSDSRPTAFFKPQLAQNGSDANGRKDTHLVKTSNSQRTSSSKDIARGNSFGQYHHQQPFPQQQPFPSHSPVDPTGGLSLKSTTTTMLPNNTNQQQYSITTHEHSNDKRLQHQVQSPSTLPTTSQPPPAVPKNNNTIFNSAHNRHKKATSKSLTRQYRSLSSSDEDIPSTSDTHYSVDDSYHGGLHTRSNSYRQRQRHKNIASNISSENDILRYIYGSSKCKNDNREAEQDGEFMMRGIGKRSSSFRSDRGIHSSGLFTENTGLTMSDKTGTTNNLASRIKKYLSSPVTWTPTADQRRMIGHMILSRNECASLTGDLGLKVIGGHRTANGRLGAFVSKVKPGSIADTIGHLRAGDEVLEWNGRALQNISHDQVYNIIKVSRTEPSIELIVSRSTLGPNDDDILNVKRPLSARSLLLEDNYYTDAMNIQTSRPYPSNQYLLNPLEQLNPANGLTHSQSLLSGTNFSRENLHQTRHLYPKGERVLQTAYLHSPSATDPVDTDMYSHYPIHQGKGTMFGRIEISLAYSFVDRQLMVTIHRAIDLGTRPDGTMRNPYVKIFLLPDRSEKSRRQSAILADSLVPVWNESFYYQGITEALLFSRVLEVTVWDYDKYDANAFLGEVLIPFDSTPLDNQALLYPLVDMDEENPIRMQLRITKQHNMGGVRPHSELGHHSTYHSNAGKTFETDGSPFYDYYNGTMDMNKRSRPPTNYQSSTNIRRSRTYDRSNQMANSRSVGGSGYFQQNGGPQNGDVNGYEENEASYNWKQQNGSGYMSDNPYSERPPVSRRGPNAVMQPFGENALGGTRYNGGNHIPGQGRFRRPHSASGFRQQPMDPGHQQPQLGSLVTYEEGGVYENQLKDQYYEGRGNVDTRSAKGRLKYEAMQENAGGYGSDASETLSQNSGQSIQTTVIRRNYMGTEEYNTASGVTVRHEAPPGDYPDDTIEIANRPHIRRANSQKTEIQQTKEMSMKERKKSIMTRLIPGRNAPVEGKRTGFARSEEVGVPDSLSVSQDRLQAPFLKQASKESTVSTDSSHSENWMPIMPDGPLGTFVENLGPGQVVGRQVLASPCLGEINIGIAANRNEIDVEIIRAKNLVVKSGSKINPAPYVKVYLLEDKSSIAKAKTSTVSKTTNPTFQQHLVFKESPRKKMIQVTVLGDYGRLERKSFMGITLIRLDDLQLSPQPIVGWYKLFHNSSLAGTGPIRKDSENSLMGPERN